MSLTNVPDGFSLAEVGLIEHNGMDVRWVLTGIKWYSRYVVWLKYFPEGSYPCLK